MQDDFSPLTFEEYAERALKTDQRSDGGSLAFPLLGLFGETGSLLSEVKKKQRDRASYVGYAAAVVEELGDVLWYLTVVAARGTISLRDIATATRRDKALSTQTGDDSFTFASIQPSHIPQKGEPTRAFETTLLRLGGEVGQLVADHGAGRLENTQSTLFHHLTIIMNTLVQAANEAGVTLEAAAVKNLAKISDRWPEAPAYPTPFDTNANDEEKLPRELVVDIFEREVHGETYVFQRCNGINIGDRLTDNAMMADDYRFHDVFHFAYVAVLSWSPVIRDLLRLKRKSDPKIDEAQDGARSALIEEGVTTWIFGQADKLFYFENKLRGDLPFDLLKHVRQFVAGTEAEQCPLWLWEEAILQGYAAFRFLRTNRRGRIRVDMINHKLSIETLP
jgi:NTP pyrophosphatase (non-canonical NTP hydrolase)